MKVPAVYMLTNKKHGVLYTGVTSDLSQRLYQHQCGNVKGFADHYNCKLLVYAELCDSMEQAIMREKQIKGWRREKKMMLIEANNVLWDDLSKQWL